MKYNSFKLIGKLYIVLVIVVSMLCANVNAYADTFDMTHKGSITMTLRTTGDNVPVKGAKFAIYKAADCGVYSGVLQHFWTSDFAPSGLDISLVDNEATASSAAAFAKSAGIAREIVVTDGAGKFVKDNLEVGLYLVVQINTVSGFTVASPFFIAVGTLSGEDVTYDSDASPKVSVKRDGGVGGDGPGPGKPVVSPYPTPKVTPGVTPKVTPTVTPQVQGQINKLPQTGQNRWQIPFLSCIGLGFILTGLMLKTGKNEE